MPQVGLVEEAVLDDVEGCDGEAKLVGESKWLLGGWEGERNGGEEIVGEV